MLRFLQSHRSFREIAAQLGDTLRVATWSLKDPSDDPDHLGLGVDFNDLNKIDALHFVGAENKLLAEGVAGSSVSRSAW